jgi:hypothetical protein
MAEFLLNFAEKIDMFWYTNDRYLSFDEYAIKG